MPDQKRLPSRSAQIEPIKRNGVEIAFKPIENRFPSGLYYYDAENQYQSLYPSIYSVKLKGQGYFPFWDYFTREYFIRNPLVNSRQAWTYTFIASLRNQGLRLSIKGGGGNSDDERLGLAAMLGSRRPTLIKDLDHLEDCLLIHRVRRLDIHGTPNDIIVHTPFIPDELYDGGWLDVINERVAKGVTRTARNKKMVTGVTEDGRAFRYLDRTVETKQRFHYDQNQISDAFGDYAARFADFALTYFQKNWHFLYSNKSGFEHDYRDLLKAELDRYGILRNDARELCYNAANKFRTIYCPSYEELMTA